MIRAVCFNPVVDRLYCIDNFAAGMQSKQIIPHVFAGGKGVNIARVVSQLGEPCALYCFLGGANGQCIRRDMQRHGVKLRALEMEGETRTTINIIDRANARETEITEAGSFLSAELESQMVAIMESEIGPGDLVVCSGIPLPGMHTDIYRRLSAVAHDKKALCVLDTNEESLRNSFPGDYFFSKPNLSELCTLHNAGIVDNEEALLRLAQKTRTMGVRNLMISTGGAGCVFVGDALCLRARVPRVTVASTIGSGDAAVAGFCVAYSRGLKLEDCVRFAMACGVSNAQHTQVGYVNSAQVQTLFDAVRIEACSEPAQ